MLSKYSPNDIYCSFLCLVIIIELQYGQNITAHTLPPRVTFNPGQVNVQTIEIQGPLRPKMVIGGFGGTQ